MNFEWKTLKWGDLASLEYGKGLRNYQSFDGKYRVFGTNGPIGWTNEPICNHPGIIIGRKGAYRGIHFSNSPFYVIDTAFFLVQKCEFDLKWAYYELLTHDINSLDSGSAIPSTSRESFYDISIQVPPIHEQQAIAHILGSLDDMIELNRQMNETLEAMARAIFKSWFVDFDPVRAKAEGRDTHLPPHIADLFPDSFQESELGLIPKGWGITKLYDVVEINRHSVKSDEINGDIEYIDISSVNVGKLSDVNRINFSDAPSRARRKVQHGDTIWSCVRPNRKSYFYIHTPPSNLIVSTGFVVLTPKKVSPNYLYAYTTTQGFVEYLTNSADGSAYPAVRSEHFASANLLLPDQKIMDVFERKVSPMRDQIVHNDRESKNLAEIRDTLLPKLISGEIRVPEAEKFGTGSIKINEER